MNVHCQGSRTLGKLALSPPGDTQSYALAAVLVLAIVLRAWGIRFGLPHDFTPDEVHEIVRALKLGAGEFTWTSGKGGLYLLLFVEYGFLFAFWWLSGQVQGATDFALRYLEDPTAFYILGRVTVALMGAATCLVAYAIGRRTHGRRIGLGAALIGATAYYHALWSHFINVDTGMTLAVWSSVLAYLVYEETLRVRWLWLAGSLAGIAVAFKIPGGIAMLLLFLAIASSPRARASARQKAKEFGVVLAAMVLATVIVAPEAVLSVGGLANNFSRILFSEATAAAGEYDASDIQYITVYHGPSYLSILLRDHNLPLVVAAALGAVIGLWRKSRWDFVWVVLVVTFIGVMTLADRPGMERYLMPVIPAFWLLGARAIDIVAGRRPALLTAVFAIILVPSLLPLVEQNHTWTRPDTRMLAKAWIEENVPAGARILMDGMQYRFIMSPPLNPDAATVAHRVQGVRRVEGSVSRGVSNRTLNLYEKAMERVEGPRYELHSTVWGLGVEPLGHYVEKCFDYVVTSSTVTGRFERQGYEEAYPASVRFYRDIQVDPRFELAYAAEPVRWRVQGPTIRVYKVESLCD